MPGLNSIILSKICHSCCTISSTHTHTHARAPFTKIYFLKTPYMNNVQPSDFLVYVILLLYVLVIHVYCAADCSTDIKQGQTPDIPQSMHIILKLDKKLHETQTHFKYMHSNTCGSSRVRLCA